MVGQSVRDRESGAGLPGSSQRRSFVRRGRNDIAHEPTLRGARGSRRQPFSAGDLETGSRFRTRDTEIRVPASGWSRGACCTASETGVADGPAISPDTFERMVDPCRVRFGPEAGSRRETPKARVPAPVGRAVPAALPRRLASLTGLRSRRRPCCPGAYPRALASPAKTWTADQWTARPSWVILCPVLLRVDG
jgi:hypothetical protein